MARARSPQRALAFAQGSPSRARAACLEAVVDRRGHVALWRGRACGVRQQAARAPVAEAGVDVEVGLEDGRGVVGIQRPRRRQVRGLAVEGAAWVLDQVGDVSACSPATAWNAPAAPGLVEGALHDLGDVVDGHESR